MVIRGNCGSQNLIEITEIEMKSLVNTYLFLYKAFECSHQFAVNAECIVFGREAFAYGHGLEVGT